MCWKDPGEFVMYIYMSVPNGKRQESGLQQMHSRLLAKFVKKFDSFYCRCILFLFYMIIAFTKEVMFYPAYVLRLYVCLSVCMLATYMSELLIIS